MAYLLPLGAWNWVSIYQNNARGLWRIYGLFHEHRGCCSRISFHYSFVGSHFALTDLWLCLGFRNVFDVPISHFFQLLWLRSRYLVARISSTVQCYIDTFVWLIDSVVTWGIEWSVRSFRKWSKPYFLLNGRKEAHTRCGTADMYVDTEKISSLHPSPKELFGPLCASNVDKRTHLAWLE